MAHQFELVTSKQLQAVIQYLELSDNERITAKAIFGCYNVASGYGHPSYSALMELTGFCERTVIRHVKAIAKLGVITIRHTGYICKRTHQRRQGNNEYIPNISRIRQLMSRPFRPVKRLLSGSSVRGAKAQQINPQQIKNIKPTAIISFSSIKAMFKTKQKGQYVDTETGLLFNNMAESEDYRNCIGYVAKRELASLIVSIVKQHKKHSLDRTLNRAWLSEIKTKLKNKKMEQQQLKDKIDYQFYLYPTETHQYEYQGFYFANQESLEAVRVRDRGWKS